MAIWKSEKEICDDLEVLFRSDGFSFAEWMIDFRLSKNVEREVALGQRERIDFVVTEKFDAGDGLVQTIKSYIEVKITLSSDNRDQLHRYFFSKEAIGRAGVEMLSDHVEVLGCLEKSNFIVMYRYVDIGLIQDGLTNIFNTYKIEYSDDGVGVGEDRELKRLISSYKRDRKHWVSLLEGDGYVPPHGKRRI